MSESPFTGQTRCSNCRTWGQKMPHTYVMMRPEGGRHVRNFCSQKCQLAWCFRFKIVPMEMLPSNVVQDMRRELLEAGT